MIASAKGKLVVTIPEGLRPVRAEDVIPGAQIRMFHEDGRYGADGMLIQVDRVAVNPDLPPFVATGDSLWAWYHWVSPRNDHNLLEVRDIVNGFMGRCFYMAVN